LEQRFEKKVSVKTLIFEKLMSYGGSSGMPRVSTHASPHCLGQP
jgi:hypothetical protein